MTRTDHEVASPAERILQAAADLLQTGGIDAVSTRAVAVAAGIQPPTIYREFGDKNGLLDSVASLLLQRYIAEKRRLVGASGNPDADLRRLWDLHVEFGLNHPDGYVLAYGQARPGRMVPATEETFELLRHEFARLGLVGRLRMSVDRATVYFHSAATGFVLTQIGLPATDRDSELSSITFDNALAAVASDSHSLRRVMSGELSGRAVALREALHDNLALPLTVAETNLLAELLNRLADCVTVPGDAA